MQPYHPPRGSGSASGSTRANHIPQSPSYEKETHMPPSGEDVRVREASEQLMREYGEGQQRLSTGTEKSIDVVISLRHNNREEWPLRYPTQVKGAMGGMSHRTMTDAEETHSGHSDVASAPRQPLRRSTTMASSSSGVSNTTTLVDPTPRGTSDDLSILRIDLQLGAGAGRHTKGLMSHIGDDSVSALFDNRLAATLDHLALLQKRIHDAHSRVLVTGDLNAGKSTLINALLRRHEVMPTDQQPLTTRFVEVVSAKENEGREEIHILPQDGRYDPTDASTFTVESIDKLEAIATDYESDPSAPPLRVFLKEADKHATHPSILHNGVVDISLIDAPGLNRDSIKTTANFARQEEIDVIVFVVSAANHFTLSAKDFIWQASREKAHLFIVVNRFDQIRDRERCRRAVLDQIKLLSPETYADAADLVHFVDSAKVALGFEDGEDADELDGAFSHLEHSLRSFVLVNRAKSKLGPAQNYLTHLLADVQVLASANALYAAQEREAARREIDNIKPALDEMKRGKEGVEERLAQEEENTTEAASLRARQELSSALERVSRGQMAVMDIPGLAMPTWTGFLGAWDYAAETRRVLLASLDQAARLAEDDARRITAEGVLRIAALADRTLPADVERNTRVFNPDAMFSAGRTRPSKLTRRASGVPALSLGLGLAQRKHMREVAMSDLVDLQHHFFLARAHLPSAPAASASASATSSSSRELIPFGSLPAEAGGLGLASLAVGAYTLSGKLIGMRQLVDGAVRLADLAAHPLTRRYAAPALAVCAAGAVVWVVYDLPAAIPRNVGRHIAEVLVVSSGVDEATPASVDGAGAGTGVDVEAVPWTDAQGRRIGLETRKVMRMACGDTRMRMDRAVDAKQEAVRKSEEGEKRAARAVKYFTGVEEQVQGIRGELVLKV